MVRKNQGSASKAGLIHLTRCLAVALAPDVTVTGIAPGLIVGQSPSVFSQEAWPAP
jgi:NAD(P)-dependent dehydrogenase (short-subunit alcohol dehydrogenase family)